MPEASPEQLRIIAAPIAPMAVIACAGSGKTYTAVRRLAELRRQLGACRGRVALLSFSNVAVDTFKREYKTLVSGASVGTAHDCIEIDTLDGFITRNVLRPHANRTMGATKAAFLVTGGETFLKGFTFSTPTYPRQVTELQVGIENAVPYFYYSDHDATHKKLDPAYAMGVVHRLGTAGAYTHNLGRYWCYRTLTGQPGILRALVCRYPHVLIDEAQDIGTVHEAIIQLLVGSGCQVSLVGDPNQGIYEFAGANGAFLTQYGQRPGVNHFRLTRNFRSVPAIVELANRLATRADTAVQAGPDPMHGVFFVPYRNADRERLVAEFQAAVASAGLRPERSAVLCRGRELADQLAGSKGAPGQGVVRLLAQAAVIRDQKGDFLGAYKLVATAIVGLLADAPLGLVARITQSGVFPEDRPLRRLVWAFTRDPASGLPAATLPGDTHWHPQLLARARALLAAIEREHGLRSTSNLGNKLARKGLPSTPLTDASDLAVGDGRPRIRVDTVHQTKGEGLDAVLYLATREHVSALLAGVDTEVGRIGYVAVTRARNLLWLGVPANALNDLRPALLAHGLQERPSLAPRP